MFKIFKFFIKLSLFFVFRLILLVRFFFKSFYSYFKFVTLFLILSQDFVIKYLLIIE